MLKYAKPLKLSRATPFRQKPSSTESYDGGEAFCGEYCIVKDFKCSPKNGQCHNCE